MNPIEQLKSVLCDPSGKCCITGSDEDRAIVDRALQALTKQPAQQEPVACQYAQDVAMPEYRCVGRCQYNTSPPAQRTWVGLTDEERGKVYADWRWSDGRTSNLALCEAIEAKLKEKNT